MSLTLLHRLAYTPPELCSFQISKDMTLSDRLAPGLCRLIHCCATIRDLATLGGNVACKACNGYRSWHQGHVFFC